MIPLPLSPCCSRNARCPLETPRLVFAGGPVRLYGLTSRSPFDSVLVFRGSLAHVLSPSGFQVTMRARLPSSLPGIRRPIFVLR